VRRPRPGERGVALLLTIWLLAVLAAIAGEFIFSSRVKAAAERNRRDGLAAFSEALAGYRAALAALAGKVQSLSLDAEGRLQIMYQGETDPVPAEAKDVPLGEGSYSWRIEDLDGRVDINTAQRPVLARLLEQVGLGPGADRDTVIDSLLDWIDTNREHRLNGAEEDYYRSLDPPYSCKDGRLDVPEELLLVRGMKEKYYTGWSDGTSTYPGLRDLITTVSGQFNAATAPKAVLEALGASAPTRPTPPSHTFAIVATGRSGPGGVVRSVRAVVQRDGDAGTIDFPLVYWSDQYIPEDSGEGATR
jgi:general secretion pathway protein K